MRAILSVLVAWLVISPASVARSDALTLDLLGAVRTSEDFGREYRATLQIGVDWETLLFGRPVTSEGLREPSPTPADGARESNDIAPDASRDESAQTPEPRGRSAPPPLVRMESRPAWARPAFALALVRVVLNLDRTGESRTVSLSTRSRTSALLPVLRLRAGRGTDQSLRYSPTLDDPDRWLVSGGADYSYEAQATWIFDRLVFTDDEIAIERLRQQAAKTRGDRAMRALEVLFVWQAARLRLEREELSAEDALELEIKALQAQSELDVLTRGWFSKHVDPS